ncbi:MAG: hypothetical protein JW768_15905 [Chitinispirillaceae bacterium]|nr:hypothetical protein [Chitinispirillaceae bacterium]
MDGEERIPDCSSPFPHRDNEVIMGELEQRLIQRAVQKHKKIFPCAPKNDLQSCFTREKDRLLFWYNTKDRSTHVVSAKLIQEKPARRKSVMPA